MSYQVLARKWRPQVFEDVVGQGHITRTLQNAITSGRLAHAFLFSGPRGVGKTTTARILAKALNCAKGPTPIPCGQCPSCIETAAGTAVDVIEIDGASNRGIEHIRELREAVRYAPVSGSYKVYVIDEVHMLTNEAFNALLKTLEEPPPHVIFIFATTEPQKIPATIHSRCQRYGFKRVSVQEMIERLRKIAAAEGIVVSDQGLAMIAKAAEGSMRDSQSLLDQAVSYSGLQIRDEDLQNTLGSVAQASLLNFTSRLLAMDAAGLLQQVDALLEQGQDMRQFLSGIVEHLRNLLVVKIAKDPGQIIELPASDIEAIQKQAAGAETEKLLLLFDSLSKTLEDMKWSAHQRFTLEIGLVKACNLVPLKPLGEVLGKIKELEATLTSGPAMRPKAPASQYISETPEPYAPSPQAAAPVTGSSPPADPADHGAVWAKIMASLRSKKPGLASALAHSTIERMTEQELVIGMRGSAFHIKKAEEPENRAVVEDIAREVLGRKVRLQLQTAPAVAPAGPGAREKAVKPSRPAEQDQAVQEIVRVFPGAHVIETNGDE